MPPAETRIVVASDGEPAPALTKGEVKRLFNFTANTMLVEILATACLVFVAKGLSDAVGDSILLAGDAEKTCKEEEGTEAVEALDVFLLVLYALGVFWVIFFIQLCRSKTTLLHSAVPVKDKASWAEPLTETLLELVKWSCKAVAVALLGNMVVAFGGGDEGEGGGEADKPDLDMACFVDCIEGCFAGLPPANQSGCNSWTTAAYHVVTECASPFCPACFPCYLPLCGEVQSTVGSGEVSSGSGELQVEEPDVCRLEQDPIGPPDPRPARIGAAALLVLGTCALAALTMRLLLPIMQRLARYVAAPSSSAAPSAVPKTLWLTALGLSFAYGVNALIQVRTTRASVIH
jgi:hypothetical protein